MVSTAPETTTYGVAAADATRTMFLEFERTWWPLASHMVRHELQGIERSLEALGVESGNGAGTPALDIIDPSSGAFALRDWQVALVPAASPAARLLGLDSGPSSWAARSMQADDRLLLRGALYYPGLAHSRGVLLVKDLLACYLRGCEQFVGDAHDYLERSVSDDDLSLALTGGVIDNVRGIALSLLSASVDAGCAPIVRSVGEVVRAAVQLLTDLYEGALDLVEFRRRTRVVVLRLGVVLTQIEASPDQLELLASSDGWAWRREADDFTTCYLSARVALLCQPHLVSDSTAICGVSRSGLEMAFVLSELARRTVAADIAVEIWKSSDTWFDVDCETKTKRPVRVVICDDSSATGKTLAACERRVRADGRRVVGVVLAHGPESGRGLPGTGRLTNPELYGTHVVGMARRAPLERRSSGRPASPDEPLVRDKQKERLARYLQRAGPTILHISCEARA